ncbi:hypothetical protein H310_04824 [Aphanomyces invadans]|uniref:Ketopantoate reductase C-terminal domain-containing protein n=1 Tax=Aphanomyces invadans TaxID=157072 RepID=A0A024UAV4_9STRA|nr:hypothetical protein H310_04824 [Aphanomyces invadans]ETW03330.1 hypothetical protein H310_04824 [Aphanomyces invadans]|eukprot:XP_008867559.1 hypothetical protein H310_04824 [Aphanomyces invadans]
MAPTTKGVQGNEAPAGRQPRVAIVYNANSSVTKRQVNLAQYLSACMSQGGWCEKVHLVALPSPHSSAPASESASFKARRRDGTVLTSSEVVQTTDVSVLFPSDVIFFCVDILQLNHAAGIVAKAIELPKGKKPQQHVIVHLGASLKRVEGFEKTHFPHKIVLQGGACFDVVLDLNGILTPLSNGSVFIERLSKDKEQALFCLDIIQSCALQVISRRNLRAIHWSNAMLTSLYVVCALTNLTVSEALRDRKCRLLYADMLHEILEVLDRVAKDKHWSLDQSAHCFLPVPSILALLPLPNAVFSIVTKLFDFGVTSGTLDDIPQLTADLVDGLTTELVYEYDDVFDLASRYNVNVRTLPQLQTLVIQAAKAKKGSPALSSAVLYSTVQPSSASRKHSMWLVLKLMLTIVFTIGLIVMLR